MSPGPGGLDGKSLLAPSQAQPRDFLFVLTMLVTGATLQDMCIANPKLTELKHPRANPRLCRVDHEGLKEIRVRAWKAKIPFASNHKINGFIYQAIASRSITRCTEESCKKKEAWSFGAAKDRAPPTRLNIV